MATIYKDKYKGGILLHSNGILDGIHDDVKYLLYANYDAQYKSFYSINYQSDLYDSINNINHYVPVDNLVTDSNNNIISFDINSEKTVIWVHGNNIAPTDYKHRINYNGIDGYLFQLNDSTKIVRDKQFLACELYLQQGYNWNNLYGIKVIVKGSISNTIYYSEILSSTQFNLSSNRHLLYGSFWVESHIIYIPLIQDEEFLISIDEIDFNDVITDVSAPNIGYITDWNDSSTAFQPIIQNQSYPDFLTTSFTIDERGFFKFQVFTAETKTLEQSILDYFNYKTGDIVPITISYNLCYTTQYDTDGDNGYKIIAVSNSYNTFLPVKIGLDIFNEFYNEEDNSIRQQSLSLELITEIRVDNKTIVRTDNVEVDYSQLLNDVQSRYTTAPQSIVTQDVTINHNINTNVIQKSVETKIIPVYQNVFIELVDNNFSYKRENVSFDLINRPSYMLIHSSEESIIYSKITSDGKYYFDMTIITPLTEDTAYELYSLDNNILLGRGVITV